MLTIKEKADSIGVRGIGGQFEMKLRWGRRKASCWIICFILSPKSAKHKKLKIHIAVNLLPLA